MLRMKLIGKKTLVPIFIQSKTDGGGANVLKKIANRCDVGIKTTTIPMDIIKAEIAAIAVILIILKKCVIVYSKVESKKYGDCVGSKGLATSNLPVIDLRVKTIIP